MRNYLNFRLIQTLHHLFWSKLFYHSRGDGRLLVVISNGHVWIIWFVIVVNGNNHLRLHSCEIRGLFYSCLKLSIIHFWRTQDRVGWGVLERHVSLNTFVFLLKNKLLIQVFFRVKMQIVVELHFILNLRVVDTALRKILAELIIRHIVVAIILHSFCCGMLLLAYFVRSIVIELIFLLLLESSNLVKRIIELSSIKTLIWDFFNNKINYLFVSIIQMIAHNIYKRPIR